jgi:single-stranded DNA-specific DHH superfamily exonuclease
MANKNADMMQVVEDSQKKYDDLLKQVRRQIERRQESKQAPIVRFVRHNQWVPVLIGLIAIAAIAGATRSNRARVQSPMGAHDGYE